jgi:UDP-N-acetyl-D-mannosaminuronic acid transferase (WecB/TagA/CpsF family)
VPQPTDDAADRLVGGLVTEERRLAASGRPVRVTWVNHYSVQGALRSAADDVRALEVCGVDGQLLRWILGHPVRTSADLVVPVLLRRDESIRRVLAIGGRGDRSAALATAFSGLAGRPVEVRSVDGYQGLPRGAELRRLVEQTAPDLLLVGMGAGLQEHVLVEGAEGMRRGYALTCGGFLDQVLQVRYYPAWAYPLRLNWLVRLLREPRRLWRRYSVDALRAVAHRAGLRAEMGTVPGMRRHAELCGAGRDGA